MSHKILGVAVAATTLVVAARSPRDSWKWHACLLVGLAIGALGEIHVEFYGTLCGDYEWLYVGECPNPNMWHIEEYISLTGIWLMFVAMLGHFSGWSSQNTRIERAPYLLPLVWLILIFPVRAIQIKCQSGRRFARRHRVRSRLSPACLPHN